MKKILGLIFATTVSTALFARVPIDPAAPPTSVPPPPPTATPIVSPAIATPPPLPPESTSTNKPAAKVKKAVKKKKAATTKTAEVKARGTNAPALPAEPLVLNEPAVAKQNNVNIRGQAHINSEVVGHLQKGDAVTVLQEVTLKHPQTDEPAKWAKIALPSSLHVWVNTSFIDASNQVVSARKLNLRTGAGENYSVAGLLHKGDAIKTVTTKGSWTQIEAPTNAFAFVAAHLLTHKAAEPVTPATPPVTPTTTIVENQTPVAPPANTPPGLPQPVVQQTPPPARPIITPPIPTPLPPPVTEPLPKRIIERDGIVGGTVSIQAPTHYELKNIENGNVMDYLYTPSTNVNLRNWKGKVVHVRGEEELDERWPNTPVLTIQRIQTVQ